MADTRHNVPPIVTRTANRKRRNIEIWNSKEWKSARDRFINGKRCSVCGTNTNLVPHHPNESDYKSKFKYLDLSGCIVLCKSCHMKIHRGYTKCSVCGKLCKSDTCWDCLPDDEKERYYIKKTMAKKKLRELRKSYEMKLKKKYRSNHQQKHS